MLSDRKQILIIDPDPWVYQSLMPLLSGSGIDVERCSSIAEAAVLKDVFFQCVIMDVELPDMKGYEAVRIVKSLSPRTAVILTAGTNSLEQERRVRAEDIVYYYLKSFDPEELQTVVREIFKKFDTLKAI